MSHHDPLHQNDGLHQQASDETGDSTFTFMVTTFTVPGLPRLRRNRHAAFRAYDELIAPITGKYGGAELGRHAGHTVTCFKDAQQAVRAAVELQAAVDEKNEAASLELPVLARIALHSGKGFYDPFERNWEGVAQALHCAEAVRGGEVLLTDETLDRLENKDEFPELLPQPVTVQRIGGCACKVLHGTEQHRVVWSPEERHLYISAVQSVFDRGGRRAAGNGGTVVIRCLDR